MVTSLARPIHTRSPVARLLDDVNAVVRRARELDQQGVKVPARRRLSIEEHRAAVRSLRQSGRAGMHRIKCREMQPMRVDLYHIAADAILAMVARDELDPRLRELLIEDWVRVSGDARERG